MTWISLGDGKKSQLDFEYVGGSNKEECQRNPCLPPKPEQMFASIIALFEKLYQTIQARDRFEASLAHFVFLRWRRISVTKPP
jgi:hypothetical protein